VNLYIMSRGRAGRVNTLQWIPPAWRHRLKIVCGSYEESEYRKIYCENVITAPEKVTNYSEKFQWIMSEADHADKTVILDDDLVFSRRSPDSPDSLISLKPGQTVEGLFEFMETLLDSCPLVGVHPRQMGQRTDPPFVQNGRIICMQGINRNVCADIKVDQMPILADVVLNCTLLSRGHANAIITTYFQDHGPCQAPGGCSIYRTPEMQRQSVEYIANRWPGYVKSVTRTPKVAKWMGDTRTDYTCQWKQLYRAGCEWVAGRSHSPDKEVREDAG
jgi:hypothetical protein